MAEKETIIDINQLEQDSHNFNRGTDEGRRLMQKSFTELGAGRSILIDREGRIIAGNKSQQAAIAAGIQRVRVIETDGTELVAVKRTDIDIDSAEGRKLALADNLTTQVNLAWDEAELEAVQAEVEGFNVADFGFEIEDMPQVTMEPRQQGEGNTQQTPTNSEVDFNSFEDKIKMELLFTIEEHAFIQQTLTQEGMTKEQVLLKLLGYAEE